MAENTPPADPSNGSPADAGSPAPSPVDWRVVAIVAVAVLFLIAAFINKKFYGKSDEPVAQSTTTTLPPGPAEPPLTPAQQYGLILQQREAEAATFLMQYGSHTLMVAEMGGAVFSKENPPRLERVEPGTFFDITSRASGVETKMILRRVLFGPDVPAFADTFPPLGLNPEQKLVFTPADKVTPEMLDEREGVIGVVIGGEARAYPTRLANYHDVINDTVAGKPIVVTWNFLAGGALVLDRSAATGPEPRRFGSAGLIFQSAVVMYDQATRSLWSPLTAQCIAGELAGTPLERMPCALTTWRAWRRMHPETDLLTATDPVLAIDYNRSFAAPQGYMSNGNLDMPYPVFGLDVANIPMFLKTQVMGIALPGGKGAKAYDIGLLVQLPVEPVTPPADTGAFVETPRARAIFKDTIAGQNISLEYDRAAVILTAKTEDGAPLMADHLLWIAWHAAHPDTEVWKEDVLRDRMKAMLPQPDTAPVTSSASEPPALPATVPAP